MTQTPPFPETQAEFDAQLRKLLTLTASRDRLPRWLDPSQPPSEADRAAWAAFTPEDADHDHDQY